MNTTKEYWPNKQEQTTQEVAKQENEKYPLAGKYLTRSSIYKANVTPNNNEKVAKYIGLTEGDF